MSNKIKKVNGVKTKEAEQNEERLDNVQPDTDSNQNQEPTKEDIPEEKKGFLTKVKESKPVTFVKKHGLKIAAFVLGTAVGVGVTAYATSGSKISAEGTADGNDSEEPKQIESSGDNTSLSDSTEQNDEI